MLQRYMNRKLSGGSKQRKFYPSPHRLGLAIYLGVLVVLAGCSHWQPAVVSPTGIPKTEETAPQISQNAAEATEKGITETDIDSGKPVTPGAGTPDESETESSTPKAAGVSSNIEDPVLRMQPLIEEALDFCQVSQDYWQKGELENALDALDRAYSLILGVDTQDIPELIQQKEDLRFMISKRILEIYASRNIVVNGNHDAIPLDLNRHVESELQRFATGREKDFFLDSYRRSGSYLAFILAAMQEAGLPEELAWLPLIESGFKTKALSKARALGLWQFIPSTGYKFGLKRDQYIDERLDPYKSTMAAIEYLKELHQIFGDWTTVLAAYNCGEGRVLRLIRSQNINYLDNFWDLYERLPLETARYVPRFLATLHIIKDPAKYGVRLPTTNPSAIFKTVSINKQVHLKNVASAIGVSREVLIDLNPELRYQITPPGDYELRVPLGKEELLLAKLDKIPKSTPPRSAFVYHRVQRGETLSTIARRYRTSVKNIMRINGLRNSNYIVAGKRLKIPQRGYTPASAVIPVPKGQRPEHYTVRSGDSLWILAKRFGTTTQQIQALNKLKTTQLHIGQVLRIPGGQSPASTGNGLLKYRVMPGDSPFKIAKKHNMSLNRFLHINALTPSSKIYPGQQLYVE